MSADTSALELRQASIAARAALAAAEEAEQAELDRVAIEGAVYKGIKVGVRVHRKSRDFWKLGPRQLAQTWEVMSITGFWHPSGGVGARLHLLIVKKSGELGIYRETTGPADVELAREVAQP